MNKHYLSPALADRKAQLLRYEFGPEEAQIALMLRDAILTRELQPGARLTTQPFEEAFSISRTLVTRVFIQLTEIGLLRRRDTLTLIAKPEGQAAREVFDYWHALAGYVAIGLAARGALSSPDRARIAAHLDEERRSDREDWSDFTRLHGEFYVLLAEISGKADLARALEQVSLLGFLAMGGTVPSHGLSEPIGQAILDGDKQAAIIAVCNSLRACEAISRSNGARSAGQLREIVRERMASP